MGSSGFRMGLLFALDSWGRPRARASQTPQTLEIMLRMVKA